MILYDIQVSAHSSRSELANPRVYTKFARTIPGYTDTSQAIVSYLIHKYDILNNEPYVAIIFSDGNAGRDFNSIMIEKLRQAGIPRIQIRGISIDKNGDNVSDRIERLKNLRFHYIITALDDFTKNGFDHLIEEVVRENLIGVKDNTWVFFGDLTRYDRVSGDRYPFNSSIVSGITVRILLFQKYLCLDCIFKYLLDTFSHLLINFLYDYMYVLSVYIL